MFKATTRCLIVLTTLLVMTLWASGSALAQAQPWPSPTDTAPLAGQTLGYGETGLSVSTTSNTATVGLAPVRAIHPRNTERCRSAWCQRRDMMERLRNCRSARCVPNVVRFVFGGRSPYALRIVSCETGGTFNPRTLGDGGDSLGIFQINVVWHHLPWVGPRERLFNPYHNAKVAWRISGGGRDWSPWTCARLI